MLKRVVLITVLCFFNYDVVAAIAAAADTATPAPAFAPSALNSTLLSNAFANLMSSLSHTISNTMSRVADPVMKEVLQTVSREFTRFALRLEFFTIAAGGHLAVPEPDAESDSEHHEIAAAATELWLRLSAMERVEEILTNATTEALKKVDAAAAAADAANPNEMHRMATILDTVFKNMDTMLGEDVELRSKYRGIRKRLKTSLPVYEHRMYIKVKPQSTREENKIFGEWFAMPLVKKLLVNKMFLMQSVRRFTSNSSAADYERYVLGRALIKLSKKSATQKRVQRGYYEAVRKTAMRLKWTIEDEQTYSGFLGELSEYSDGIVMRLFGRLEKYFKKDEVMKADLEAMKEHVRTSDDQQVFQIDYWPL